MFAIAGPTVLQGSHKPSCKHLQQCAAATCAMVTHSARPLPTAACHATLRHAPTESQGVPVLPAAPTPAQPTAPPAIQPGSLDFEYTAYAILRTDAKRGGQEARPRQTQKKRRGSRVQMFEHMKGNASVASLLYDDEEESRAFPDGRPPQAQHSKGAQKQPLLWYGARQVCCILSGTAVGALMREAQKKAAFTNECVTV